jgi:hypothetical protein
LIENKQVFVASNGWLDVTPYQRAHSFASAVTMDNYSQPFVAASAQARNKESHANTVMRVKNYAYTIASSKDRRVIISITEYQHLWMRFGKSKFVSKIESKVLDAGQT